MRLNIPFTLQSSVSSSLALSSITNLELLSLEILPYQLSLYGECQPHEKARNIRSQDEPPKIQLTGKDLVISPPILSPPSCHAMEI
jgi:hypothetical protein